MHDHMSNTLNTPVEVLESEYPVRVRRYALRSGSGGSGRYRGGDGLLREIEFLVRTTVTILSERRCFAPYGLAGGEAGACGQNRILHDGAEEGLPDKVTLDLRPGDVLTIATPGGGGLGALPPGPDR